MFTEFRELVAEVRSLISGLKALRAEDLAAEDQKIGVYSFIARVMFGA